MNLHLFRILSFFPFPICRGWNIEFFSVFSHRPSWHFYIHGRQHSTQAFVWQRMQFIFCVYNAVKTDFQHSFVYGRSISYLAAYKLPKRDRVSRKENILVFDAAADGTLMEVQFLGDFLNRQRNGAGTCPKRYSFCLSKIKRIILIRVDSRRSRSCCILMIRWFWSSK